MRKAIGSRVELTIRQCANAIAQGGAIRCPPDLGFDEVVHASIQRDRTLRRVPLEELPPALRVTEYWYVFQGTIGISRNLPDQGGQMANHLFGGVIDNPIAIVDYLQLEL